MHKYKHRTISSAQKASIYAEGQQAFMEGKPRGHNPYAANNTAFAAIWWNGWDTGEEESVKDRPGKKKT